MRTLYQSNNFNIIGEIGNYTRAPDFHDILLTNSGKKIPVLPRGSFIFPFEWIIGYIPVGKNLYIAAVRSLIPLFFRKINRKIKNSDNNGFTNLKVISKNCICYS